MASKVPLEIWLKITHYLPPKDLQKLCTLSRAFFHAAMDARYHEVDLLERRLHGSGMEKTLRRLQRLRQSHIACRVRHIKVDLWVFYDYFSRMIPPSSSIMILDNGMLVAQKISCQESELLMSMMETLSSLSCITKCDVVWPNHSELIYTMASLWPSIPSNLQSLKLASSLQNIHMLLLSTSVHFPTLEDVLVNFWRPPPQKGADEGRFLTSIIPFLNNHSSTLRSITFLWSPDHEDDGLVEVSCLFNTLGRFPRLRHLGVYFGCQTTAIQISRPTIFAQFLSAHANQLQSITIKLIYLDFSIRDPSLILYTGDISRLLFNVPFSNMLTLDISQSHPETVIFPDAYLETVSCFSDTLTTLTLEPHFPLTYAKVESIISLFSHRSPDTGLKNVFLVVCVISPELIDLLASGLPGLVRLSLRVNLLMPQKFGPDSFEFDGNMPIPSKLLEMFRAEMETRVYDKWALSHLDIYALRGGDLSSIAEIIAERIPTSGAREKVEVNSYGIKRIMPVLPDIVSLTL